MHGRWIESNEARRRLGAAALAVLVLGLGILASWPVEPPAELARPGISPGPAGAGDSPGAAPGPRAAQPPRLDPAGPPGVDRILTCEVAREDGGAIPGAELAWSVGAERGELVTGADGFARVALGGAHSGAFAPVVSVRARAPGFAPGEGVARPDGAGYSIRLVLRRAPGVVGRVVDARLAPAPARVTLFYGAGNGAAAERQAVSAACDDQGRFRIELAPGRPDELLAVQQEAGSARVALAHLEPAEDGVLRLPDVVLRPGLSISGRVLCPDRTGLPHVGVEARALDGSLTQSASTDHQGRFRLVGLEAGSYAVWAPGPRPGLERPVERAAGGAPIELIVERRYLWVQVLDENDEPLPAGRLECTSLGADGAPIESLVQSPVLGPDGCALIEASTERVVLRLHPDLGATIEQPLSLLPGCLHAHTIIVPGTR